MVKVLKSFKSAHEAVNWMSQNRIEDASIEMTGTLKSMGMGPVPSGNYHIVLKNYPHSTLPISRTPTTEANQTAIRRDFVEDDPRLGNTRGGNVPARDSIPAKTTLGDDASNYRIRVPGTPTTPSYSRQGVAGEQVDPSSVSIPGESPLSPSNRPSTGRGGLVVKEEAIKEKLGMPTGSEPEYDRLSDKRVQGLAALAPSSDGERWVSPGQEKSISQKALIDIITKSVMDTLVMKGRINQLINAYEQGDPNAAKLLDGLNYQAGNTAGRFQNEAANLIGVATPKEAGETARQRRIGQWEDEGFTPEEIEDPSLVTDAPGVGEKYFTEGLERAGGGAESTRKERLTNLARAALERTNISDSF
jgi:hypothetical protein